MQPDADRHGSASTVVLQGLSLLRILAAWRHLRRATIVTIFIPYSLDDVQADRWPERAAQRALTWLTQGRAARVDRLTRNRLSYLNAEASDAYVEAAMRRVRRMSSYRILSQLVGHQALDRVYARMLLPHLSAHSQFYRFAEHLARQHGSVVLVPAGEEPWATHQHFDLTGTWIPRTVQVLNACCRARRLLASGTLNWIFWFVVVARHLLSSCRVWSRRDPLVSAPVIIPLAWGVVDKARRLRSESGDVPLQRLQWDNGSLLGGALNADTVAFYYSTWPFTPAQRALQERLMAARGLRWFDPARFRADWRHCRMVGSMTLRLLKGFCRHPAITLEPTEVVRIGGAIISGVLKELLFNQRVDYRVRVEWADYDPQSIVRTIVANRFGRATIGIHHSANGLTRVFPELRYAFVNRLCVWHEGFRAAYGHHWDVMDCVPIGNHRLDYVIQALEPERLERLRAHVRQRWGLAGALALVALPNHPAGVEYQQPARFVELYTGMLRALAEIPGLWIVIRARHADSFQQYLREPLIQTLVAHPRVISDQAELSTQEWMAVADVVIGASRSSIVVEAGTAGKKCFSFDTEGWGAVAYAGYGTDFVITTAEQFVRAVRSALTGSLPLNCQWDRFAREQTYFADGQNIQRFRDAIWELVEQVRRGDFASHRLRAAHPVRSGAEGDAHRLTEALAGMPSCGEAR